MDIKLRDYQEAAIQGVLDWWIVHKRFGENCLVVLPTASGKTIVFCTLIQQFLNDYPGTRILVLAHRKELIDQAEKKLLSVWPSAPTGVYAASLGRRELAPVTIASRDTLANVIDHVGQFDLIVVDEAHNISPGEETRYRKIINGLQEKNPNLHVIGFTATPYRTGQGYIYGDDDKHLFKGLAYEAHIKPLIEAGYLCPVTAIAVDQDAVADTSGVKTTAGDFNQKQLEEAVADEDLIKSALDEWETLAYYNGRRSTIFFCVSVLHAQLVSEEMHRRGYDVPVVHGKTPQDERDDITQAFENGELIGVANVGIYTEGTDIPRIDCIALLRPTKSLGLYLQMVGRGLRKHDSKQNTLVLDFGGCIERFGPIDTARPVGRKRKPDPRTKTCPSCREVHGIFKRKCPCGYEFEPPPYKVCEKCNEKNPTSAVKCIACGEPFIHHDKKAATGGILSSESAYKTFPVEAVSCQTMVSRSSGNTYLKVIYQVSLFEYFYQNLMIGYDGYAGSKAISQWRSMVTDHATVPADPHDAMVMINNGKTSFRQVQSITVDMTTKYKDIVSIEYMKEAA